MIRNGCCGSIRGANILPEIVGHEAQREAVLVATLRTVGAHRVEGTTIRRIAQMAAASTGFIARCFRD